VDIFRQFKLSKSVRLIGVGAGTLQPASVPVQAELFADEDQERDRKWEKVDRAMDAVTERFGSHAVVRGGPGRSKKSQP
jgi:hypothetical protein